MKVEPLDDRIVIEPISGDEMSSGGIVIPDSAREKSQKGKVLEVGPGRLLDNGQRGEMALAPGDVVLYAKYAGNELKIDGEEVLVLRQHDCLVKLVD